MGTCYRQYNPLIANVHSYYNNLTDKTNTNIKYGSLKAKLPRNKYIINNSYATIKTEGLITR